MQCRPQASQPSSPSAQDCSRAAQRSASMQHPAGAMEPVLLLLCIPSCQGCVAHSALFLLLGFAFGSCYPCLAQEGFVVA